MMALSIIFCIVILFLIWIEVIPFRKWIYKIRIKAIGMQSRCLIEVASILDKVFK